MFAAAARPCRAPGVWSAAGRHVERSGTHMLPHANPQKRDSGYFSEVDPGAEVYPVKSGLDTDVTKRGGRWQSDFIWNTNWKDKLDYEDSLRRQAESESEGSGGEGEYEPGKLRLASKVDLNSMDVDLTAQLLAKKKPLQPQQPQQAQQQGGQRAGRRRVGTADPPTRLEQKAWARSGKFSRKVVAATPTNEADEEQRAAVLAAEERRYEELKAELQLWASGLTAGCLAITFVFYGRDVAASYGVGALGGLMYLRLLNKSVDDFGRGMGSALGQPRLLIPIILALGYNRYNTMLAEETGLTLQLLPILLGFFTYKGAVVAKQALTLFGELAAQGRPVAGGGDAGGSGGAPGQDGQAAVDVTSVDRAFNKRVLTQ